MYHAPDGHNAGKGQYDPAYVVIVGNMARIIGPFTSYTEAQAHIDGVLTMLPRWDGYTFTVARLDAPDTTHPVLATVERA